MSFAQNLNRICHERGTTLTSTLRKLGFSTSKVTAINKGQVPNNETDLLKIARALECSVMDFFADEDDITPVQPADEDEEDILRVYRSLSRRSKHEFMAMVYDFENRNELQGDNGDSAAI